MKPLSGWILLGLIAAALGAGSCGYRFAGGGPLPGGIRRVFVPMAQNRTGESGLESAVTNALRYEITRSGNQVVADRREADAVLSASITAVASETVSRATTSTALERQARLTVVVEYTPIDENSSSPWPRRTVTATEAYKVAANRVATDRNRRLALEKAAARLAQKVITGISTDF
jgi:hypothetical protein